MKTRAFLAASLAAAAGILAGCQTPLPPGAEPGPHGTMAYDVLIEASAPGARIEANGESIGNTPVHLKIFGDRDGTFHDFGSYYYIIQALPLVTNQFQQIKVFGTGRNFSHEDYIPKQIYFDMNRSAPPPAFNYPPPAYYYGPPAYYYGWPYYYGPSFRFYWGAPYWHRW